MFSMKHQLTSKSYCESVRSRLGIIGCGRWIPDRGECDSLDGKWDMKNESRIIKISWLTKEKFKTEILIVIVIGNNYMNFQIINGTAKFYFHKSKVIILSNVWLNRILQFRKQKSNFYYSHSKYDWTISKIEIMQTS